MAGSTALDDARARRRRQQRELGRTLLLDAAETVFGRSGFHEAALKEVAELAGFSVGAVYTFFENKEDLFRQVFVRRGQEFMPGLREICSAPGERAADALHELVDYSVGWFRRHSRFGRLYLSTASPTLLVDERLVDALVAENFHEAMALQAALFRRGADAGVLVDGDPEVLSRMLSGMLCAYQATDPAVLTDDPHAAGRLPLAELQALVDRAFVRH